MGTGVVNAGEAVGSAAVSSVNAVGNSSLKKGFVFIKKRGLNYVIKLAFKDSFRQIS